MNILKMRLSAQHKLMKEGQVAMLSKSVAVAVGAYNPLTNALDPPADSTATKSWKFFGIETTEKQEFIDGKVRTWSDEFHSGTSITTSVNKFFMSPGYVTTDGVIHYDIVPVEGDKLTLASGKVYTVETVDSISPTGINCGFDLGINK